MSDHTLPTDRDKIVEDPDHETGLLVRLKSLGADVEALRDSDTWRTWLSVAAKFHRYSFGNQLLIAMQRPDATRVAGYRKWQDLNRQVRKGERGIRICAPIVRKNDDGTSRIAAFKVVSVFDITQTEGEDLPAPPPWPMATGDATTLLESIVAMVEKHTDLRVVLNDNTMVGNRDARGWYEPAEKQITVRTYLYEADGLVEAEVPVPTASQCKTLLHELGHHFDTERESSDRATKEIVAESVAYLCGVNLGLDATEGATVYLANWGADTTAILRAGRRIVAAVKSIEKLLDADHYTVAAKA